MATSHGEGEAAADKVRVSGTDGVEVSGTTEVEVGATTQRSSNNTILEATLVAIITTLVGLLLVFSVWVIPISVLDFFVNNSELILFGAFGIAAVVMLYMRLNLFRHIFKRG